MRPMPFRILRLGLSLLITQIPLNPWRESTEMTTSTHSFGAPYVALAHTGAISIVRWLADERLHLLLHETNGITEVKFDPSTGETSPLRIPPSQNSASRTAEHTPEPANQSPVAVLKTRWSPDARYRADIIAPEPVEGAPIRATLLRLSDEASGRTYTWDEAPRLITDIAWAPDSRWLAVLGVTEITTDGAERAQLFLLDAGTGETQLARQEYFGGGMWGQQLTWSPDGMQLAVSCPTATEGRVCILLAGNGKHLPAPGVSFDELQSSVQPQRLPQRVSTAAYVPPNEIRLEMYQLTLGGARRQPYTLCQPGSTAWGCTVFCDEVDFPCVRTTTLPYPYASNPITIPIESDYLLDVVPLEMGTYYHPTALTAQAAAARSYAYRILYDGRAVNNSTAFQAFIPYKFESLPTASFPDNPNNPCASGNLNTRQRIVCDAVAPRYYIAHDITPDAFIPAFAEFCADAWLRTVDGGPSYLKGVDDPISSGCDANDYGHQRGMSQEGASRWARGNRCSYAGAGDDPWSVQWNDARQILTHYYTGIQLRDSAGTRLTPDYRWAPLQIDWRSGGVHPPLLQPEETTIVTFTVQNTGVFTWTGQVSLAYFGWEDESGGPVIPITTSVTITQIVAPGESVRVGLPLTAPPQIDAVKRYRLYFDMQLDEPGVAPIRFSTREPERPWPAVEAEITVMVLPYKAFLPLTLRQAMD